MKCKELMVGDWITNEDKIPMQIYSVYGNCTYADDYKSALWEFRDKEYEPQPIEITEELLEANGWDVFRYKIEDDIPTDCSKEENGNVLEWKNEELSIWLDYKPGDDGVYADILVPCKYVHQLQQVLRLAGMTELANNFKVK